MSVVALVPAAGRGERLGGSVPKALVPVRGEPLLVHAVIPVLAVADTVKRVDAAGVVVDTPDRAGLRIVQTPQGFALDTLQRAYAAFPEDTTDPTDDAGLVERLGVPVGTVAGHPHAM